MTVMFVLRSDAAHPNKLVCSLLTATTKGPTTIMRTFLLLLVPLLAPGASAWLPSTIIQRQQSSASSSTTRLFNENVEEQLRDQLAEKNAGDVALSEQYAVADGSGLEALNQLQGDSETKYAPAVTSAQKSAALEQQIERMTQPRAYPLFVLEKVVEIVETFVSDAVESLQKTGLWYGEIKEKEIPAVKERIVVLGTGWGGASFLKEIDTDIYDVTVISPRNFFLFTPMLAGASVGTVEYRSICEPVREIAPKARYLEATAQSIDATNRIIECESVSCQGNSCSIESFQVEYDRLIVSVGAQTNTFGSKLLDWNTFSF